MPIENRQDQHTNDNKQQDVGSMSFQAPKTSNDVSTDNTYAVYVLVVLTLTYLVNQCNMFSLIATNNSMAPDIGYGEKTCVAVNSSDGQLCLENSSECDTLDTNPLCEWRYVGRGLQYQLLAGPVFTILFSLSGVPLGLISELQNFRRKWVLVTCVVLWSLMTSLAGFATQYWHLVVTRILLGVFSAGCVPFSVSIVVPYFSQANRGAALGFYNWGVYLGYSASYLLLATERRLGWRAVYFLAGLPGFLLAILIALTVREPTSRTEDNEKSADDVTTTIAKLRRAAGYFCNPSLLLLCLGGAVRNGAGLVWAYNLVLFFDEYHSDTRVEDWMSWLPVVFGSLGAFGGGYISDRISRNTGPSGRLVVLTSCVLLSAPFQVATLLLAMPWAFLCQIPALLIGEMWIGVCVTLVVDFVPSDLTASAVAIYFFVIMILGGNSNLLVPPLADRLNRQVALLVTFPGFYLVAAALFALTMLLVRRQRTRCI